MLALAIAARIPFIRVSTTDLINFPGVLEHLVAEDRNVGPWEQGQSRSFDVFYSFSDVEISQDIYDELVDAGKSLVIVNPETHLHFMFDAGEVPVPKEMVVDLLDELIPKKNLEEIAACFSGLTLKTCSEVIRLTMAQYKSLTAKGVLTIRSNIVGTLRGLARVDTALPLYVCPKEIDKWLNINHAYFLEAPDPRLMPRGVLLSGLPGVGKTSAAKYIANVLEVPLYRLDLSSVMTKWVGESEQTFSRVLSTLDQEAPAVVLIDEIEKLFNDNDDQGVTSRLLSQLLFWLAEHKSQVLTVMTTNDASKLPPELYRAGRIDLCLTIYPLTKELEIWNLAQMILNQFVKKPAKGQLSDLKKALQSLLRPKDGSDCVTHAEVDQTVRDLIKAKNWMKLKS
jgi:hypothetical protein